MLQAIWMVFNSLTLHLALNIFKKGLRVHSYFPHSNYANIWVSPFTMTVKGVRNVHIPNELWVPQGSQVVVNHICMFDQGGVLSVSDKDD